MAYKVGNGSVCEAALQTTWGTSTAPTTLINMTSESINVTVEKGDEGNLLSSKTANQRDLMSIKVDGSISTILRPEFADWLFEAALGTKTVDSTGAYCYTLAEPNTDLPVSTIVMSRGGIVKTYPDVTVKSIKLSAAAQDYVKVDIDITGVKELSSSDGGAQTVKTMSYTIPSYKSLYAMLYYGTGGTESEKLSQSLPVESCDITIDNGLEDAPATYASELYSERPVVGLRSVTVDFSIPYSEKMDSFRKTYLMSLKDSYLALKLRFLSYDTREYVEVYLPNVSITSGEGNVGGTGIIDSSFSGEALSVGSAEPVTVTVGHVAT